MTGVAVPATAVDAAVADLVADPSGGLYASTYETGRLVALVPWLAGHDRRVAHLLDTQHPDGSWDGPGGFALVPTLSAVEALLSLGRADVDAAVRRGLGALDRLLAAADRDGLAGTLIPFLIVPALVADINARLGRERLAQPAGADTAALAALRDGGWRNPVSAFYLEIVGPAAAGSPDVPRADGVVGCSAAATAAWLGPVEPAPGGPGAGSARFLAAAQAILGGPVAGLTSMTFFERAWAHRALSWAGVPAERTAALLAGLPADPGAGDVPAAPGFAPDSESSALLLLAAADRDGAIAEPAGLWAYDRGTHFLTTVPVGAPSVITNARVLEALDRYRRQGPADADRYADAVGRLTRHLLDQQAPDGSWQDRWHVSPHYATTSCALALHAAGVAGPVARAADWTRAAQRPDGSWGRWTGTAEETAYALMLLMSVPGDPEPVARGLAFLRGADPTDPHPPLWVGKDLYAPVNLVRAAVLAVLAKGEGRP
ncbi:prenyltransferase/squalene oxidase repeat-containing protein [Saccharothrix syringae]|uniref:NcmF n=1 Tax=Saccharothrix syringae TaxID=103733 RepID=A0A1X9WEQ1_SACSY|nr:prenyltransferase/squalene oxidase repeat-containing protein [Saccharothrix syringae]ARS01479.1 NcmF [Saccharothrix syringae]QFZ19279.1 hypothetical protein EKG83_19205 [Saccharothrix syringae]